MADSAGVRVVENTAPDRELDWRFDPVVRLGGRQEGPESFFTVNPGLVGTDADGNVYVLDPNAHRIVVFDSDGAHLRTMGREGEGPGELSMPIGLTVRPDGTAMVDDIGKGTLVAFGPDGSPSDAEERALPGTRRAFANDGLFSLLGDSNEDNEFVYRLFWISEADTTVLVDSRRPAGGVAELESCGLTLSDMPRIFEPYPAWDADGPRVAVRDGIAYEIDVFERDRHVARFRRSVEPIPTTSDLAVRDLGEAMTIMTSAGRRECDPQEVIEQRGVSEFVPTIRNLRVDPVGRLWVSRGGPRPERTPTDVIDADGTYVGTLPAELPFPLGFLPDGRMLVAETDDLDVSRLVVYEVEEVPSGFEPE